MTRVLVALLALSVALAAAQCPYTGLTGWVASGLATSGDVVVPAGMTVKFDLAGTSTFNSILVQGTLAFDDVDINLSVAYIKVRSVGPLAILDIFRDISFF